MRLPAAARPIASHTCLRRIVHSHGTLSRDTFVQNVGHQPWVVANYTKSTRWFNSIAFFGVYLEKRKGKSLSKTMEKNNKFIRLVWCIVRRGAWLRMLKQPKREPKSIWYGFRNWRCISDKTFHVTSSMLVSSPPININWMECKFFACDWRTVAGARKGTSLHFVSLVRRDNDRRYFNSHVSPDNKLINCLFLLYF